ncbi:MAG TPA: DUF2284 domain-containing protein [bacterium]|nr:DUF2284 domain-containing protein [bacterium]HPQ67020.1 DUF2284 domain-containing protein [bacterium]
MPVADNGGREIGTAREYIRQSRRLAPVSAAGATADFADFYDRRAEALGALLERRHAADPALAPGVLRAGLMPPLSSVVAERVKRFCRIPYRTAEGTIPSCPGILRGWKGCPPYAPAVETTRELLSRARGFLVVQLEADEDELSQNRVHPFIARTAQALRGEGFAVLAAYASGPCRVCPRGCAEGEECRRPLRRLFALEACGFWVDALCSAAGAFPVCGGGPRPIRWIRDWNLPSQDTKSVRYTGGFLLG